MFGISITRILIGGIVVLLIVAFIASKSCSSSRKEAEQAKQEARSSEAYAGAAKDAVATVTTNAEGEASLKEVVAEAAKEIANAEGSDQKVSPAARDAALRAACRLPNYRDAPACQVLEPRP